PGHRHHDDGVDEGLGHCDEPLAYGVVGLCGRRGDRCRTHAGLVGENTASKPKLDGNDEHGTGKAAHRGRAGECVVHNHGESAGHVADVHQENVEGGDDVDEDHEGHKACGH